MKLSYIPVRMWLGIEMGHVKVKELKDHLSAYLRKIKNGESLIVQERKTPIALITPIKDPEQTKLYQKFLPLIRKGILHWNGNKPKGAANPPVSRGKSLSEMVLEGR